MKEFHCRVGLKDGVCLEGGRWIERESEVGKICYILSHPCTWEPGQFCTTTLPRGRSECGPFTGSPTRPLALEVSRLR